MNRIIWFEEGPYATGTTPSDNPAGTPTSDPYMPTGSPASNQGDPNVANVPQDKMGGPAQDFHSDPKHPDMPEERKHLDFPQWRKEFIKSSIKGDVQEMKELISEVSHRKLSSEHSKYVYDNLQILLLREQSNIDKACKEIKKLVKEELDHNNPGVSIVNHMVSVLDTEPMLNNVFIKLFGLYDMKAGPHRKFIAALTGSLQVGSGAGETPDLIFYDKDFTVEMSARMNARFGDIHIGPWNLNTDDPHRFLKAPELKRLEEGSPEEKDVLKRRVVMESIAKMYETRAFIINVVDPEGTVYTIGWDIATSLRAGYKDGKLVVRDSKSDGTEAMIDVNGDIISFVELKVMYVKETDEVDDDGQPYKKEIDFIVKKNGQLYLTAGLHLLKEAVSSFPGMVIRDKPLQGNPSDLEALQKCVPSVSSLIMSQCG